MVDIEQRIEAPEHVEPDYAGFEVTDDRLERGMHRTFVGGLWEEMGQKQLDFLVEQGLTPDQRLLDVGCGSFRAGRLLVDYLDPGNYYGIDINHSLIERGYLNELTEEQRDRLPTTNLRVTDRFDADFGEPFDMAIAQSVFTHMSLNNCRLALHRIGKSMKPGSKFFVTFFEGAGHQPIDAVLQHGTRFTERNSYWYYRQDLRWITRRTPWSFRYIGDWGHPRGQRMIEYTRLTEAEIAQRDHAAAAAAAPAPGGAGLLTKIKRRIGG